MEKSKKRDELSYDKLLKSFQGWNAYAKWADNFKLRKEIIARMNTLTNPYLKSKKAKGF